MHDPLHVTAGHVVCFKIVACNVGKSGLVGFDEAGYDNTRRYVADTHQEKLHERYLYA